MPDREPEIVLAVEDLPALSDRSVSANDNDDDSSSDFVIDAASLFQDQLRSVCSLVPICGGFARHEASMESGGKL